MKSASLAIEPLMLAERDREYLKQLRRNRWVGKCEMGSPDINDAIVSPDVKCQASSCLTLQGCRGEADGRCGGMGSGHFLWAQGLQGELF